MELHFGRLVDYQFTSSVEDDLDEIASGSRESVEWLTRFYFGSAEGNEGGMARAGGLKLMVESNLADIDAREINSIPIGDAPDGEPLIVRVGRYGPYVTKGSGDETSRASLPDDLAPDGSRSSERSSCWRPRAVTASWASTRSAASPSP